MVKVLIGIVSNNRMNILPKAIDSALIQNYTNKEIKIFDDNSSDNTKLLKEKYPQVNWFFSLVNKGYLYARNIMMQETDAEYYCSLDDDSWFLKEDTLTGAIDYLEKYNDVAAIGFDMATPAEPEIKPKKGPFETNLFIGCGHVLRLSAVKEVGYYYSFPGFYGGEEKDLCIRLIDKGYKIIKSPGDYVWHDKSNVARNLNEQHISGVCNDLVFCWIRTPIAILLPLLLIKILKHIRFGLFNKQQMLVLSTLAGIVKFFKFLFQGKIKREPVSFKAFSEYNKLSKNF